MKIDQLQDPKRRSGRTTRLVETAKRLAVDGKAVYVIAKQWQQLQRQIDAEVPGSGIKCEPTVPDGFDWRTMRVYGSHPNCVWLIDAHVIESDSRFAAMFEMMTRFDREETR